MNIITEIDQIQKELKLVRLTLTAWSAVLPSLGTSMSCPAPTSEVQPSKGVGLLGEDEHQGVTPGRHQHGRNCRWCRIYFGCFGIISTEMFGNSNTDNPRISYMGLSQNIQILISHWKGLNFDGRWWACPSSTSLRKLDASAVQANF